MNVIKLGGTELDEGELDEFPEGTTTVVHHYTYESWEGSGYAAFLLAGVWRGDTIGHCSCNGPEISGCLKWPVLTADEMRAAVDEATTCDTQRAVFQEVLKGVEPMRAEDAYEEAKKVQATRLAIKLKPVLERIAEKVALGLLETEVCEKGAIDPQVEEELKKLGYALRVDAGYHVVSWNNPKRTERMGR